MQRMAVGTFLFLLLVPWPAAINQAQGMKGQPLTRDKWKQTGQVSTINKPLSKVEEEIRGSDLNNHQSFSKSYDQALLPDPMTFNGRK